MAKVTLSKDTKHYLDMIIDANIISFINNDGEIEDEEIESAVFYIQAQLQLALLNHKFKR